MKILSCLLIIVFTFTEPCFSQVKSMSPNPAHKRVWRGWNKKRDGYNPYLKKKKKDRPSTKMARSEKKEIRKQRRAYRKQMRRGKKNTSRK